MSAETGHIGASVAAIAAGTAILGAALAGLGAAWWAWVSFALWGLLWLTAASGLSDPASRKFLAGTLRKSNFTQIYTTLARRNVMGVWTRLCDPAPDSASTPTLFRAALTWRLYDLALRLAVVYPILLLVGQWVVTEAAGRVGSLVVLPAADFWPDRATVILFVLILTVGVIGESGRLLVKKVAYRLILILAVGAVTLALLVALGLTAKGEVEFAVFSAFGAASAVAFASAGVGAFVFAAAGGVAIAALGAGAVALAVIFAVAVAVAFALDALDKRGHQRLARLLLTALVICTVIIGATPLDWSEVDANRRGLFLFLAVLPLLNALFDVVSYAVTLSLVRRGLRAALPFLWGLADLAMACVLLLGLGAVLVAVIYGLNTLAGVPFLDLPALFEGVRAEPGAYVWLYLMLFSTLLPTLLHAFLSLLGVQGIWPRTLRRPVAGWVEAAPQSPLHAIRASLGLSLIWAVPLLLLGAGLWALWHFAGPGVMAGLGLYLDGLTWIAGGPVGAI